MSIRFTCPTCLMVIESPDAAANQKVECPKCTQRLLVPPLDESKRKTVLGMPATQEQPTPPKAVSQKKGDATSNLPPLRDVDRRIAQLETFRHLYGLIAAAFLAGGAWVANRLFPRLWPTVLGDLHPKYGSLFLPLCVAWGTLGWFAVYQLFQPRITRLRNLRRRVEEEEEFD